MSEGGGSLVLHQRVILVNSNGAYGSSLRYDGGEPANTMTGVVGFLRYERQEDCI